MYISIEHFPSFQIFTWRMIYFSMVVEYDECTLNIFIFNGHDNMIRLLFQSSISVMNQRLCLHDGHDIILLLLQLFVTTIRVVFLIPQLLINNNLGFQYSKIFSFHYFNIKVSHRLVDRCSNLEYVIYIEYIIYISKISYIEYIPGSHLENRDFLSKTGIIMSLLRLLTPGVCFGVCVGDQLIFVPKDSFMVGFRGNSKGCSTS